MAVTPSDLHLLSASQAADLIRKDQLSVQEYARALLARVKRRDPIVRAWVFLDTDLVLEQAKKLDQLPRDKRGPLHGVAVGIKDIFLTKGKRMRQ